MKIDIMILWKPLFYFLCFKYFWLGLKISSFGERDLIYNDDAHCRETIKPQFLWSPVKHSYFSIYKLKCLVSNFFLTLKGEVTLLRKTETALVGKKP